MVLTVAADELGVGGKLRDGSIHCNLPCSVISSSFFFSEQSDVDDIVMTVLGVGDELEDGSIHCNLPCSVISSSFFSSEHSDVDDIVMTVLGVGDELEDGSIHCNLPRSSVFSLSQSSEQSDEDDILITVLADELGVANELEVKSIYGSSLCSVISVGMAKDMSCVDGCALISTHGIGLK
jgi:hypothetical protein